MSQQEAASIGPFQPIPSQQQASMSAESEHGSPFAQTNEPLGPAMPDYQAEEAAAESRSRRRRAWTVIALALIIPAGAAAALALVLTGGEDTGPTETVTRVSATAETSAAAQTTSAAVTVAPTTTSTSTETTTQTATVAAQPATASAEATQAAQTTAATESSAATSATAEATATLTPEARLAAWPEIERVEVVAGETLWLLAYQYDTTISAIVLLNGITDPESLSVGQVLSIPVGFAEEVSLTGETIEAAVATSESRDVDSGGSSVAITTAVTLSAAAGTPAELASWPNTVQMIIVAGDSLDAIANANGTTVEAIQVLNGIADPNLIFEGQEILVPVGYDVAFDLSSSTAVEIVLTDTSAPAEDDMLEPVTAEPAATVGEQDDMLETEGGAGDQDMLEE